MRQSKLILASLLAVPLANKLWLALGTTELGIDGGFYTNLAQHVRDGQGLVTDASLYHLGFERFPHPSAVYPLWPLVYGYLARGFELTSLAIWLPPILYVVSLGFAYLWACSLWPGPVFSKRWPSFNAGHLLVLILATAEPFFVATSMPYTEGLAFCLLFGGLWRSTRILTRPTFVAGLELGAWLAGMVLARSQLLVFLAALGASVVWFLVSGPGRRALVAMLAGCGLSFGLLVAPFCAFVLAYYPNANVLTYLRFELARPNHLLSVFPVYVETRTLWEYLLDRSQGLWVAFWPLGRYSYWNAFHVFSWAVVLAVASFIGSSRQWFTRAQDLLRTAGGPASRAKVLAWVWALAGFATVHTIHKVYFQEWHFAARQGLTAIFLIFLTLGATLKSPRVWVRNLAVGILMCGSVQAVIATSLTTFAYTANARNNGSLSSYFPDLCAWLTTERTARGHLTVAVNNNQAQRLAWRTSDIGYHWVHTTTTAADLEVMFTRLGSDYLVTFGPFADHAFAADAIGFAERFELVWQGENEVRAFARRDQSGSHPPEAK